MNGLVQLVKVIREKCEETARIERDRQGILKGKEAASPGPTTNGARGAVSLAEMRSAMAEAIRAVLRLAKRSG